MSSRTTSLLKALLQLMKFIALISGGKDSIFNIMQCVKQGHELVAVCNLFNGDEGKELDSYMYQTVGTNVAQAIAEALGKPLYRRQITGTPKITSLEYTGEKAGDEVEDLYELIKEVKQKYPDIQGVSSGAIWSTYQKKRVEDVCARLGLQSLAYLWQRDQPELLHEMIESGMDCIIIKVASYGLTDKHLNKTIKELQPFFLKLKGECDMNVCGQGGEYESLTLDCPLYKKKLKIDEFQVIHHDKSMFAPVAYLQISKISLVEK